MDGLRSWSFTPAGVAVSQTTFPATGVRTVTATAPDGSCSVSTWLVGRFAGVTNYDANNAIVGGTACAYDAFGRCNAVTDVRRGQTSYTFNHADLVTKEASPDAGCTGNGSEITQTAYDLCLRPTTVTLPDKTTTTRTYYPNGLVWQEYGARTYPVTYTYDYAGRLQTMTTWTNFAATAGAAVTTWVYDNAGWLLQKVYPDPATGQAGPTNLTYSYSAGGRLLQFENARQQFINYDFDPRTGDVLDQSAGDPQAGLHLRPAGARGDR